MSKLGFTNRTFVCLHRHGVYFRVLGKGLSFDTDMPRLFSERMGYRKVLRIGRLSIEVLR